MFLKGIAFFAIIGTCYAIDHAYSSQSIIHYSGDNNNEKQIEVAAPTHKVIVPVLTKVAQVVPVAQYVINEDSHHKGHAISSQNIQRHDVPAKPPADWIVEHGPAKYKFEYKVEDPHSGDKKFQQEARDGYAVKGTYSLHEADGSIRTVKYAADKHTGFTADVKHTTTHVEEHKHHY